MQAYASSIPSLFNKILLLVYGTSTGTSAVLPYLTLLTLGYGHMLRGLLFWKPFSLNQMWG